MVSDQCTTVQSIFQRLAQAHIHTTRMDSAEIKTRRETINSMVRGYHAFYGPLANHNQFICVNKQDSLAVPATTVMTRGPAAVTRAPSLRKVSVPYWVILRVDNAVLLCRY